MSDSASCQIASPVFSAFLDGTACLNPVSEGAGGMVKAHAFHACVFCGHLVLIGWCITRWLPMERNTLDEQIKQEVSDKPVQMMEKPVEKPNKPLRISGLVGSIVTAFLLGKKQ